MSENTERLDVDVDGLYSRISGMLQSLDALKRYKDERSIELPKCADGECVRIGDEIEHPNGKRGEVLGINYRKNDGTSLFVLGDNGLAYTYELNQVRHAYPMEEAGTVPAAIADELVKIADSLESQWTRGDIRAVNAYEARLAHRIRKAIGEGGAE